MVLQLSQYVFFKSPEITLWASIMINFYDSNLYSHECIIFLCILKVPTSAFSNISDRIPSPMNKTFAAPNTQPLMSAPVPTGQS